MMEDIDPKAIIVGLVLWRDSGIAFMLRVASPQGDKNTS